MIQVEQVSISLQHVPIVCDASFSVEKGKIIMLLGENGCGKTTLIRGMVNEIPLSQGKITYKGKDVSQMSIRERAAVFSYIPQIKPLIDHLYCRDVVVSGLCRQMHFFQIPSQSDYQKAYDIMRSFDIHQLFDKKIDEINPSEVEFFIASKLYEGNSSDHELLHNIVTSLPSKYLLRIQNIKSVLIALGNVQKS